MCEWCKRLVLRNWKWDRHTESFGLKWHMFNTMKSQWHREWHIRRDWRRGAIWCDEHCTDYNLGNRSYKPARGVGQRYYDRI